MINERMKWLAGIRLYEGSSMYCPNCGEYLGKQSEVEANSPRSDGTYEDGYKVGAKVIIYCDNCGNKFSHRCEYDTR